MSDAPQVDSSRILFDFFERVSDATDVTAVMTAANIAREEMLGVPFEPHPEG